MNPLKNLQINDGAWESLVRDAELQKCHPVVMAIEKGFIKELEYVEDLKNHVELSWLKQEFFNKEPDLEHLKTFEYEKMYAAGIIPIGAWDGKNYFAKISSEAVSKESFAIESSLLEPVFVLASWTGLKKWFGLWEIAVIKKEIPQGFKDTSKQVLLNINFDTVSVLSDDNAEPNPVVILAALPSPQPVPVVDEPGALTFNFDSILKPHASPPKPPAPIAPPQVPKFQVEVAVNTSTDILCNIQAIPFDVVTNSAKMCRSYDDLCGLMMGAWRTFFEEIMVLNLKDDNMTSHKWTGNWQLLPNPVQVMIDQPCIFKIAKDTLHPFHGAIVTNSINQEFFDKVNGGKIPEHVTIIPITGPEEVECLLLGMCTKQSGQRINIDSLEVAAKLFSDQMKVILAVPGARDSHIQKAAV